MEPLLMSVPNICEWCGGTGISRCGGCHVAYYCCKEHQVEHWSVHKKVCKKSVLRVTPVSANMNEQSVSNLILPSSNWGQSNMPGILNGEINQMAMPGNIYSPSNCNIAPPVTSGNPIEFSIPNEDLFSSLSNELFSSDNEFWSLIDACTQNISELDLYLGGKESSVDQISGSQDQSSNLFIPSNDPSSSVNVEDLNLMECAPLTKICENVVRDLNMYGICVLDRFIGAKSGNLILEEVKNLYQRGVFKKGELVNPRAYPSIETIRSDVTTWIDGTEPYCQNIGSLMQKLDLVVATCNKMQNNGQLSKYKLHRRTKAMVACYPGKHTHYKKHIDNTNKDGRCITCIYYLNKNWDVKRHGGLLRMYPAARPSDIAQIEPIFDRMIFFWSDKRNPHEVLPAFATRFAITVWYFDADERDEALSRVRQKQLQAQTTS